jgi:hypothetical protein
MGDVDGLVEDEKNVQKILDFVTAQPGLNAIILMLNGAVPRVGSKTKYVLQRLYSLCPEAFEKRLYILFSNTQLQPNFDKTQIRVPVNPDNIFSIDNLLFSPAGMKFDSLSRGDKAKISSNYRECQSILSTLFEDWKKTGYERPEGIIF